MSKAPGRVRKASGIAVGGKAAACLTTILLPRPLLPMGMQLGASGTMPTGLKRVGRRSKGIGFRKTCYDNFMGRITRGQGRQIAGVLMFCSLLVLLACSAPPVNPPTVSPVQGPQPPLVMFSLPAAAERATPGSREWRFSLLIDDGRTIQDPLSIVCLADVAREASGIGVRLFEERISETEPGQSGASVSCSAFLYSVSKPADINVPGQNNTVLAYQVRLDEATRRVTEVRRIAPQYGLSPESSTRVPVDELNQNSQKFFLSSRMGVPVPLRKGNIVAYLDATIARFREGSRIHYEPCLLPIAVRITDEKHTPVDCWVAHGSVFGTSTVITAYISKTEGIVFKSIMTDKGQRWRIIKTMYPSRPGSRDRL